jgi:hypothetical protein
MKKYNYVQDLFLDLPEIVLLVGNGEMKNKGELIDSYDFVIRFNDFQIEGYESDVGTKVNGISFHCSDFTFPHTQNLEKNYLRYRDKSHIFSTSPFFQNSKNDILHLQPDTQLLNVFKPIQINPEIRLSSGTSLALNLSLFFDKKIHLIGFDFMESGHYWDPNFSNNQFWADMGKTIPAHNSNYERNIISKINTIKFI